VPLLLAPFFRVESYLTMKHATTAGIFYRYSFFNFFDSLTVGCLCAFLLARKREWLEGVLTRRPWMVLLAAVVAITVPYALRKMFLLGGFIVPFGSIVGSFGFAALMMQSIVLPEFWVFRPLNWRWVRWIGVLSYSIYIWQQIFCTEPEQFGLNPHWWNSFPGWLVTALAAAMISYYGLERPLFRLRSRFRD
jgi:peptidoglycan/LPS O-acetylase OafA/YrhL